MSSGGGGTDNDVNDAKPEAKPDETTQPESSKPISTEEESEENRNQTGEVAIENPVPVGGVRHAEPLSPNAQVGSYPQMYPPHLTPQPGAGYYLQVYPQAQVTPEQSSPAGPHGVYDVSSFLQQHAALGGQFGTPGSGQYGGIPHPPLSPRSNSVPPASPLFPRASNASGSDPTTGLPLMTPGTPGQGMSTSGLPYLSPGQGSGSFGGMYPSYAASSFASNGAGSATSDEPWVERNAQQPSSYPPNSASPQPYASRPSSRSYSFDEMLPPPMLEHQDSSGSNPGYSPYSGGQGGALSAGGTLFPQQQWGYASPADMYNAPPSPLQPRPASLMAPYPGVLPPAMGPAGMRPPLGPPYGQPAGMYYPASPGPPIQTAGTNKGPDGANLFIFHIPNNFTNLDMYNLFCSYGNLLSVRIMIERDTGRSRGFGFVSYDNPESAAVAIKELNGYAIGNKRLKVQHKQIRAHDHQHQHHAHQGGYGGGGEWVGGGSFHGEGGEGLGRGAESAGSGWYDESQLQGVPQSAEHQTDGVEKHQQEAERRVEVGEKTESLHAPSTGVLPPKLPDMNEETEGSSGLSPLGQLEPLRSALPEIDDSVARK